MGRRQPNKDSTDQIDILLATNRQNDDILYCSQWNKMNKAIKFKMDYLHFQMSTIMKLSFLLIVSISFHSSMDFVSVNNLKRKNYLKVLCQDRKMILESYY